MTDPLEAKDSNARDQGEGPRTQAQVFFKKKGFQTIFSGELEKKMFKTCFHAIHKILTIQKIVLSSSRGQGNFRGLEASRPRPRTSKCVLEAKDVLKDSTSDSHINTKYSTIVIFFLLYCNIVSD